MCVRMIFKIYLITKTWNTILFLLFLVIGFNLTCLILLQHYFRWHFITSSHQFLILFFVCDWVSWEQWPGHIFVFWLSINWQVHLIAWSKSKTEKTKPKMENLSPGKKQHKRSNNEKLSDTNHSGSTNINFTQNGCNMSKENGITHKQL